MIPALAGTMRPCSVAKLLLVNHRRVAVLGYIFTTEALNRSTRLLSPIARIEAIKAALVWVQSLTPITRSFPKLSSCRPAKNLTIYSGILRKVSRHWISVDS
jgi:hypothetical protein